eukprot:snap_masked-scaffold_6-processed-gene-16.49-mRNA-1 protein AED:1.00 eAED:1.00 QI:0/-1/0/0/-1/1/1/0/67
MKPSAKGKSHTRNLSKKINGNTIKEEKGTNLLGPYSLYQKHHEQCNKNFIKEIMDDMIELKKRKHKK